MIETSETREIMQVLREEHATSDKLWCVVYVIDALNCLTMCLPEIVYESRLVFK